MVKRNISWTKYLAVFAITSLVFLIGLLIGSYMTGLKLQQVQDLEQSLRMDTMAMELQYLFLSQEPCETDTGLITDELYQIGERLDYMENSLGADNAQVQSLKKYYSLLEIRHWLFLKTITERCESDLKFVLYFYSADEKDCPRCVEQGYALTFLRKEYPNIRTYSFDVEISNPALDIVKKTYIRDYTNLPILIVGNHTYNGFKDKRELMSILGLNASEPGTADDRVKFD
jgi:hypothetical protein